MNNLYQDWERGNMVKQLEMKPRREDRLVFWQTVAVVAATLAAIAAILFGYYQSQIQQTNADLIAHANIKPLLNTYFEWTNDSKSLTLINYGIGSALITSIEFIRTDGKSSSSSLVDLLDINDGFNYAYFGTSGSYIEPGGKTVLATSKYLEGLDSDQREKIFKSWVDQMSNISIRIAYTDILGEKQKDLIVRAIPIKADQSS
jgi:hypothetical protein